MQMKFPFLEWVEVELDEKEHVWNEYNVVRGTYLVEHTRNSFPLDRFSNPILLITNRWSFHLYPEMKYRFHGKELQ